MAGNSKPTPRRSPPSSTQADGIASRKAASADWGDTPKKGGIRGEVKLALILIITLGGAFGYIVHRKFDALRKNLIAAEEPNAGDFKPLEGSPDPRSEVVLPTPQGEGSNSAESAEDWTEHDLLRQTASAETTPLLSVTGDAGRTIPERTEIIGTESDATIGEQVGLPFPDAPPQSEPATVEAETPAWSPDEGGEPLDLFGDGPAVTESSPPAASVPPATSEDFQSFEPAPATANTPTAGPTTDPFPNANAEATETAILTEADKTPATSDLFAPGGEIPFAAEEVSAVATNETSDTASAPSADLFGPLPTTADASPADFEPSTVEEPVFLPPREAVVEDSGQVAKPLVVQSEPAPSELFEPAPLTPSTKEPSRTDIPLLVGPQEPALVGASPSTEPQFGTDTVSSTADIDPFQPPVADAQPNQTLNVQRGSEPDPFAPSPFEPAAAEPHRLQQNIPMTPRPVAEGAPSAFPVAPPSASGRFERAPAPTPLPEAQPTPLERPQFARATPAFDAGESSPRGGFTSDDLYTVRPGDNYWSISKAHYGTVRYFAALTEYNRDRIPDPKKMRPGLQVAIPDATVLESQYPQLFTGPSPAVLTPVRPPAQTGEFFVRAGEPMYRVGAGDTLSSIAQKHLGRASRWEQIYGMNRNVLPKPDRLKPGLELRLPHDASQVSAAGR